MEAEAEALSVGDALGQLHAALRAAGVVPAGVQTAVEAVAVAVGRQWKRVLVEAPGAVGPRDTAVAARQDTGVRMLVAGRRVPQGEEQRPFLRHHLRPEVARRSVGRVDRLAG